MKRWHKIGLGLYAVAWLVSLVGCTESNIPKGTIRANGLPTSLSVRVLPDTTVCFGSPVTIFATVKDELGNPASGGVIFATNGNPGQTVTGVLAQGVAQQQFTFNATGGATSQANQILIIANDLSQTVNVTAVQCP